MKKKLCMVLAAMLTAGSVSAYGAETAFTEIPHTFTAKVGTTEFKKDGEVQPLDVEIYIKEGYTMLPLRTFMTAALENASMHWDGKMGIATVLAGVNILTFDIKENRISKNGTEIPVFGKMEIRDGRVFVPLRNWGNILNLIGYWVSEEDIIWNASEKVAEVRAVERNLDLSAFSEGLEKPVISGEGEEAEHSFAMTQEYDYMKNIGDGYFFAESFTDETVGLGNYAGDLENVRYLLDAEGTVLQTYDTGTDNYMRDGNEGTFLVGRRTAQGHGNGVIDWEGNTVIPFIYSSVEPFSEGLALVETASHGEVRAGFADRTGKLVIPMQYYEAESFSEGLAAVCVRDEGVWTDGDYKHYTEWGYIDKTGKLVIDAKYKSVSPFYEGLAAVRTNEGVGYIDKNGNEVIPCKYRWGGYFRNGVTYVTEEEGWKTWLINTKGEKLKLIAEGKYVSYVSDRIEEVDGLKNGVVQMEQIIDLPDGDHKHIFTYYDETGQISYEAYQLKKELSEGLAPVFDEVTKKYGYVDENGVWVIAPSFQQAEPFEDGYAVVANEITQADGTEDAEWGIIQHPDL